MCFLLKADIKIKPEIELKESKNSITPKTDVVIKQKIKTPIKLENEMIAVEKTESLPTKEIKPKIKPKVKNKFEIRRSLPSCKTHIMFKYGRRVTNMVIGSCILVVKVVS